MESSSEIVRECAQRLLQAAEQLAAPRSAAASAGKENNTSSQLRQVDPPRPGDDTAIEEHHRLFGFRPAASVSGGPKRPLPSGSAARRRVHPYTRPYLGPKKSTWTRSFICLARVQQETLPTTNERITLTMAGLGEQKITFNKEGRASHVHAKIVEVFPALNEVGGYEILRLAEGRSKALVALPIPAGGYGVPYLKSILGQAKGYIRPIQKDIEIENCASMENEVS